MDVVGIETGIMAVGTETGFIPGHTPVLANAIGECFCLVRWLIKQLRSDFDPREGSLNLTSKLSVMV